MGKSGKIFNSLVQKFKNVQTRYFLLSVIAVQFVLHLPVFSMPPMGQHVWRQVMGLSMARNYYEEDRSFLDSAQDIRVGIEDGGEIYTEFPWLYWLIGKSYHLTGFSHLNGRLTAFLFAVLLLLGCYRLMRELQFDETSSRWFVFFMGFTPYFFYYSVSFLPNLPSLALFIWGVVLIQSRLELQKLDSFYFLGVLLLTLATTTKQLYLFYGLPVLYLFLRNFFNTRRWDVLLAGIGSGMFLLGVNYALYRYGLEMNSMAPWERSSTVQLHDSQLPTEWSSYVRIFQAALTTWFLEMYVNTAAIPFFLAGCYYCIRNKTWQSDHSGFWIAWIISFVFLSFSFLDKFEQHGYYLTSISVLAALGSTYGAVQFYQKPLGRKVTAVLLVLIPIVMIGRVSHRWIDTKQVPDELLDYPEVFQEHIPKDRQVLVHGDATPVVYLYFLNRNGLSLNLKTLPVSEFKKYRQKGFDYFVSQAEPGTLPSLAGQEYQILSRIGDFHILRFQ